MDAYDCLRKRRDIRGSIQKDVHDDLIRRIVDNENNRSRKISSWYYEPSTQVFYRDK